MTVLEVLKLAADHFQKHGSDSARLDAEVLLAHTLGLRRLDLYLKFDRALSEAELSKYRALTARRANGEPVAYLVGHKEFMGLDFVVTPAVLIPNPDTEILVQRAIELAREAGRPLRIADVSDEQRLGRAGLAFPMPGRRTWPLYQGLGETLWREGWNGLLAPSAAHPAGRILCLFIDDPLASQRSRFRRLPSCRSHRCRPPECVREGPGE